MRISVQEARKRLATAGIELGRSFHDNNGPRSVTGFQVTTPVGTQVMMRSREVLGLLRDLNLLTGTS